jgi:hypothetical protein
LRPNNSLLWYHFFAWHCTKRKIIFKNLPLQNPTLLFPMKLIQLPSAVMYRTCHTAKLPVNCSHLLEKHKPIRPLEKEEGTFVANVTELGPNAAPFTATVMAAHCSFLNFLFASVLPASVSSLECQLTVLHQYFDIQAPIYNNCSIKLQNELLAIFGFIYSTFNDGEYVNLLSYLRNSNYITFKPTADSITEHQTKPPQL